MLVVFDQPGSWAKGWVARRRGVPAVSTAQTVAGVGEEDRHAAR